MQRSPTHRPAVSARLRAAFACGWTAVLLGACAQAPAPATAPGEKLAATATGAAQKMKPGQTCARPVYPAEALRKRWSGVSTISFLIGEDGLVKDAEITKSSGFPLLDETAKSALMLCQFKPARKDGKPFASWQPVQYVWTLQ